MEEFVIPHRFHIKVAYVVGTLAIDGGAPAWPDNPDRETLTLLVNLGLIVDVVDVPGGIPCFMAAKELAEMTPPYTKMIEEYKRQREYFRRTPDKIIIEVMSHLQQEIGYGLLGSWRNYLMRRKVDPNAKPQFVIGD